MLFRDGKYKFFCGIARLSAEHIYVKDHAFVNAFVRDTSVKTAATDKYNVVGRKHIPLVVYKKLKATRKNSYYFELVVPMSFHNVSRMLSVNVIILNGKSLISAISFFNVFRIAHIISLKSEYCYSFYVYLHKYYTILCDIIQV